MGVSSFDVIRANAFIGPQPLTTTGQIFYVSNSSVPAPGGIGGSDGNSGLSPKEPFSTIDGAVGQCTADRGDVIIVGPNHVETVSAAAGLVLDVAGITLVGIGNGANRPTINFTTATGADMDVDAVDISMINFLFTGGFDALTGPIDINSADFRMSDCEYRDVTGQTVDALVAVNADRLRISNYYHNGATAAGAASAIQLNSCDDVEIKKFRIDGDFSVSCIESVTAANTDLKIHNGYARTRNAADIIITLQATDTGDIGPSLYFRLQDDAANITQCITASSNCQFYDDIWVSNADGERGLQWDGPISADL